MLFRGVVLGLEELAFLLVVLDVFCVSMGPVTEVEGEDDVDFCSFSSADLALATMPVLMDFTCKKRQEKIHSHGICIMVFCRYAVGQIAC